MSKKKKRIDSLESALEKASETIEALSSESEMKASAEGENQDQRAEEKSEVLKEYDGEALNEIPHANEEEGDVNLEGTLFEMALSDISAIPEVTAPEGPRKSEVETISELQTQIELLKQEIEKLEEFKKAQNRILAEIGDFVALFPDTPIEKIPDTVWESVKQGAPLAASYALYEKRMVAEAKRIEEINAKNARKSPGAAGKDTAGEYFSPEDVRRMSRAEVHANYSKIKDSMKKWM